MSALPMTARKPKRQEVLAVPEADDSQFRKADVIAAAGGKGKAADYARRAILLRMYLDDEGYTADALENARRLLGLTRDADVWVPWPLIAAWSGWEVLALIVR